MIEQSLWMIILKGTVYAALMPSQEPIYQGPIWPCLKSVFRLIENTHVSPHPPLSSDAGAFFYEINNPVPKLEQETDV